MAFSKELWSENSRRKRERERERESLAEQSVRTGLKKIICDVVVWLI